MRNIYLRGLLAAMLLTCGAHVQAAPASASPILTAEESEDLLFMREEEKLARDTYLRLYERWSLTTLANIAVSEQRHMDSMLDLLEKYGLPDPAARNPVGVFTNPTLQSLYDDLVAQGTEAPVNALLVGGVIEETDMRDIMAAMAAATRKDIDKVYENLLCGSRNHLRAFAGSIEALTGQAYIAQILSQAEVDAIVDAPDELCGIAVPKGSTPAR